MATSRACWELVEVDVEERVNLHAVGADVEPAGVVEGREERVRDVHPPDIGTRVHNSRFDRIRISSAVSMPGSFSCGSR